MKINTGEHFVISNPNCGNGILEIHYREKLVLMCTRSSDDEGWFVGSYNGSYYSLNTRDIRQVRLISGFQYVDTGEIVIKTS